MGYSLQKNLSIYIHKYIHTLLFLLVLNLNKKNGWIYMGVIQC
jgi:hypothetical protein